MSQGAQLTGTLHNLFIKKGIIKGEKVNKLPKNIPVKAPEEVVAPAPKKEEAPETVEETPVVEEAPEATPAVEVVEESAPAVEETPAA
jgi:hypothetical protein